MMKKQKKIKKDGVYIETEKILEFEESELQKINLDRVVNKIKEDLSDIFED